MEAEGLSLLEPEPEGRIRNMSEYPDPDSNLQSGGEDGGVRDNSTELY